MAETISPENVFQRLGIRVTRHPGMFAGVAAKREALISSERATEIFGPESQRKIDLVLSSQQEDFPKFLVKIFGLYDQSEASGSPGHGRGHIIDCLRVVASGFDRFKDAGRPLTESQKLEVVLAVIGHDLGRSVEMQARVRDKNKEQGDGGVITERLLEYLTPVWAHKRLLAGVPIPDEFWQRVLYDIASGFSSRTGYPTSDLVHEADRMQLGGLAMVARLVALGMAVHDRDFIFPSKKQLRKENFNLPNPYREPVEELLQRMNFWMRNTYKPTSPDGKIYDDERVIQTAVILMLGMTDIPQLFEIIFAPELNKIPPNTEAKFNKSIAPELFAEALRRRDEFLKGAHLGGCNTVDTLRLAHALIDVEGLATPENFGYQINWQFQHRPYLVNRNRLYIMWYSLLGRHTEREKMLDAKDGGTTGVSGWLDNIVRQELLAREARFNKLDL